MKATKATRRFGILVLAAALPLVFTGCGSGDEGSGSADGGDGARAASGGGDHPAPRKRRARRGADTGVGDAEAGKALFMATCVACHTPEGGAKPNLGKDMIHSEFTKGLTDDEFIAFITTGRPTSDPLNTSGVDMPPKGGNPSLKGQDLRDIVTFVRSLQDKEGVEHK